jgi:hypothetical protein
VACIQVHFWQVQVCTMLFSYKYFGICAAKTTLLCFEIARAEAADRIDTTPRLPLAEIDG